MVTTGKTIYNVNFFSKMRVVAEIQEPNVVLKQSFIDLGVVYVGVPVNNEIVFESLNFADSSFNIGKVGERNV